MSTPKPNFYPDASFAEYVSWEAVNQSTLKHFEKSAAHVRAYQQLPKETPAQKLGSAAHLAVLDPGAFKDAYFVGPEGDGRTTGVKKAWAAAQDENPDAIGLKPAEHRACIGIQESIWNHSYAASLLGGNGYNEASFVWKDIRTGLLCKGRADRIAIAPDGWSAVVDLKTIKKDASLQQIEWAIRDWSYHIQGAFYLDGLNELMPAERKWLLIFVEKSPPYGVRVIEVDLAAMELGRRRIRKYLQMYAECVDTGVWPGYGSGVEVVGVPEYEYRKEEREMEEDE